MLSSHVKFVQTDRWTDRQTMVKQYAPDLSIRGHKKLIYTVKNNFVLFRTIALNSRSCHVFFLKVAI